MNTSDVIEVYLAARRAQGVQIRSGARALRQFARETGNLPLHDVTPQAVATFLRGHGALSAAWTTKFRLLTGLYRFALVRGYVARNGTKRLWAQNVSIIVQNGQILAKPRTVLALFDPKPEGVPEGLLPGRE